MLWLSLLLACSDPVDDTAVPAPLVDWPAGPLALMRLSRTLDGEVVATAEDPGAGCPEGWVLAGYDDRWPLCVTAGTAVSISHRADGTPLQLESDDGCAAGWAPAGWDDRRLWCHSPEAQTIAPIGRLPDGEARLPGEHECPADWLEIGSDSDRAWCARPDRRAVFVLSGVGTEALAPDELSLDDCPADAPGVGFFAGSLVCVASAHTAAVELTRSEDGTSLAASGGDPAGVCGAATPIGFRGDRAVCAAAADGVLALSRDTAGRPRSDFAVEGTICPEGSSVAGGRGSLVVCLVPSP